MPIVAGRIAALAALSIASTAALAADDAASRAIAGVMNEVVKPGEPGCTVGVLRDGALRQALVFGMADLARGKPLDSHAVFNLASVSKQFTAFAVLLLEQQGKLVLETCAAGEVLKPGEAGEFATADGSLSLRFESGGENADGFVCRSSGLRCLPFRKLKEPFE